MKVKQLIKKLQELNPNDNIEVNDYKLGLVDISHVVNGDGGISYLEINPESCSLPEKEKPKKLRNKNPKQ